MASDDQEKAFRHYDGLGVRYHEARKQGLQRWLTERDTRIIVELLDPRPGQSALDAGCGTGNQARRLKAMGLHVCGADFSPRMLEVVRPHIDEVVQADLDELDLGRQFDRIICNGVLDFVRDPARCVERMAAHLKPGGRLVVVAPRRSAFGGVYLLWHRFTSKIPVHLFHRHSFDEAARRAGLTLLEVRHPMLHTIAFAWARA